MPKSKYPLSKQSWLYSLVYPWVSNGLELFFDGFHVKGLENFPKSGPVMLLANHQNAMIDPLICCRVVPHQLHWLTRSDVFKNPSVAQLLYRLNMLPIYREKDKMADQSQRNEEVFEVCRTRLSKGAVVSMFPEGSHRGKKQLMVPLKKGFARLAFSSIERDPQLMELKIVPMALDYSDFYQKHPRLILEVGQPIALKDFWEEYQADNNRGINGLIKSVHQSLSSLMVDIKDEEDYTILEEMGPAFEQLSHEGPIESWQQYRDFCNGYHLVSPEEKQEIRDYHHQISELKLTVKEAEMSFKVKFKDWLMWCIEFLPGNVGRLLFAPLAMFTEYFIRKNVQDLLFYNSIRYAFFTFFSPVYVLIVWMILSNTLSISGGVNQLMFLGVLISLGLFSISWSRYNLKISALRKARAARRGNPSEWEKLVLIRKKWRQRYEK